MNREHRIAMLGTGFISRFYTTALHGSRGSDLVHLVCSRSADRAEDDGAERGRYDATLDKPVQLLVTRSSDGGKSWSQPGELDVSDIGGGSAYGKILTMPDRSMLMNVYAETTRPAGSDPDQSERSRLATSEPVSSLWRPTTPLSHSRSSGSGFSTRTISWLTRCGNVPSGS